MHDVSSRCINQSWRSPPRQRGHTILPADAFPLAGEQGGDIQYRSVFVWFSCTASPSTSTIDCLKWYPAGASRGIERYCTRTVDGASVPADFRIDPLASREGRIVLTSGGILQFDHRGRINDELVYPGEAWQSPMSVQRAQYDLAQVRTDRIKLKRLEVA